MTNENHLFPVKLSIMAVMGAFSLAVLSLAGNFFVTATPQPSIQVQQPIAATSQDINNNQSNRPAAGICYSSCHIDSDCTSGLVCGPISCQEGTVCNPNLVCQKADCPIDSKCTCTTNNSSEVKK